MPLSLYYRHNILALALFYSYTSLLNAISLHFVVFKVGNKTKTDFEATQQRTHAHIYIYVNAFSVTLHAYTSNATCMCKCIRTHKGLT